MTIPALAAVVVIAALAGAGVVVAFGTYSDTVAIATGDVQQVQSDLEVQNVDVDGPGNNVDEVVLAINNTVEEDVTADVNVALMNGLEVETEGSATGEAFDAGEAREVTIPVDRTNRNDYDTVDVLLEEV